MNVFDIIKKISEGDKTLTTDDIKKDYNPFLVNRGMSMYPDTILYANEMNMCGHVAPEMQCDYYFSSIKPKKRYSKWYKAEKSDLIPVLAKYFNVGINEAKELIPFADEEFLAKLKRIGGMEKNG